MEKVSAFGEERERKRKEIYAVCLNRMIGVIK
jgi:hypothetical protein